MRQQYSQEVANFAPPSAILEVNESQQSSVPSLAPKVSVAQASSFLHFPPGDDLGSGAISPSVIASLARESPRLHVPKGHQAALYRQTSPKLESVEEERLQAFACAQRQPASSTSDVSAQKSYLSAAGGNSGGATASILSPAHALKQQHAGDKQKQ